MPNTKSAIRRTKKTKIQATVNKIRKSKYKSTVKEMTAYITAGKIKEAQAFLPKFNTKLMKITKTGVIKKKNCFKKNFKNYKKNS